ncbi:hypothetical protein L5515_014272 [Caenorhabditis briggsae]|nr:hypothetical protein L5515_014272 [Caenorhabditis briggsae]
MAKELGKQFAADLAKLAAKDGVNLTDSAEASGEFAQSEDEKISSTVAPVEGESTTIEASGEDDDDNKPAFVTGAPTDSTAVSSEISSIETTTTTVEETTTLESTTASEETEKVSTVSSDESVVSTTKLPESSGELESTTSPVAQESSGEESTTTSGALNTPESTTVEGSGEETTTSSSAESTTEEASTTTEEVEGSGGTAAESKDEEASTTESPSFVTGKTSSGSEEDEEEGADTSAFLTGIDESMFNKSLIGDTHREDLPNNVGFVPSSEPKPKSKDEEEEEEESDSETTVSDYEDKVSRKESSTAEPTTTITEVSGSTTEPPVQLVKDLIDALAAGGLDFVLGRPRKPTSQAAQDLINRKLSPIQRLLPQAIENKHECTTGRVRFVATEMIDLSQHFERDAVAFSLEHCARMCYETSCLRAAFTRFPRPVCLMHYADQKTAHLDTNCTDVVPTTSWTFTKINQVVAIDCVTCADEKKAHDITSFSVDEPSSSSENAPLHQGVSSKCDGRVEFQVIPVASLPKLNITNDVPASSPADCARKCFETEHCKTAGFIPSPSGTIAQGVCLLTSDDVVCGNLADFVPQHAALHPFVVSCIRCTSCTYNIRPVTPTRTMPTMKVHEKAENVQDCAKLCSDMKCTMAKYENNTKICSMTREPVTEESCPQEVATQIHDSLLPISIECVKCSGN